MNCRRLPATLITSRRNLTFMTVDGLRWQLMTTRRVAAKGAKVPRADPQEYIIQRHVVSAIAINRRLRHHIMTIDVIWCVTIEGTPWRQPKGRLPSGPPHGRGHQLSSIAIGLGRSLIQMTVAYKS